MAIDPSHPLPLQAGNSIVTDLKSHADNLTRYARGNTPLALYRGNEDSTMTQAGQDRLKRIANATGATVDLFLIPGVGHTSLFPGGKVTNASGAIPVLNHSFTWLSEHIGVALR